MPDDTHDYQGDIDTVQAMAQVPKILDVCARTTEMGFVAIARVTEDRWITCASRDTLGFGLTPGDELPVETTICDSIRDSRSLVVIDDAQTDETYCDHQTPEMYKFRSYISVPIIASDGAFFGTLCAIDPDPKTLNTPERLGMFQLFADLVAMQLENHEAMAATQVMLRAEQETAKLREEFIAVVGHDLRNPIAALGSGLTIAQKSANPDQTEIFEHMRHALHRMNAIIGNLLDFARGRLGSGIELGTLEAADLDTIVEDVVHEIRLVTDRSIEVTTDLHHPVYCDGQRIGQLVSNLLSNAVTHGAADQPVRILAVVSGDSLRIEIANTGPDIPEAIRPSLFHPFRRGDKPDQQGLGLGLYISQEIAKAHGGELSVTSAQGETVFIFQMPLGRAEAGHGQTLSQGRAAE